MLDRPLTFPPKKILVPLDRSDAAAAAWKSAKALAAAYGAAVEGLYVHDWLFAPELIPSPTDVQAALAALRARVGAAKEDKIGAVAGIVGTTILNWAEGLAFDLVVMGTHGRTGAERLLLGSVAEAVVRASPVPVLVVRRPLAKVRTVLAPVNFQPYSQRGLWDAAEIAKELGARLTVFHAVDAPVYGGAGSMKGPRHMLADAVNRLSPEARAACKPRTSLAFGNPAEQIALAAIHHDLVVLVTHQRGFLSGAVLGTTSERLLRHCETAVLALPSGRPVAGKGRPAARAAARR